MDTLELYEKIENYIKNRLSPDDRAAFESEIQANPELAAEVALHRAIIDAAGEKEMIAFRKMMEEVASDVSVDDLDSQTDTQPLTPKASSSQTKIIRLRWIMAVAASFLLIVWFIWNQSSEKYSQQELFAANFEVPEALVLGNSRGDSAHVQVTEEALQLVYLADSVYRLKEYETALTYLNRAASATKREDLISEINRSKSIIFLVLGNGVEAERVLQGITTGFVEDKAWYLAMSLLIQKNKKEEARSALEAFIANADQYSSVRQEKVKAILDNME